MYYSIIHYMQYAGFIISCVTNPLLIYLLCTKSNSLMGKYSVLMLIFSCFSIFYALIDVLTLPTMHITETGLIIFLGSVIADNREVGIPVIAIYGGCFTLCVGLLTNQFLYRYMVVCRNEDLRWFRGYRCLLAYSHCFLSTAFWMTFVIIYSTPTPQWEDMFRNELKNYYDVDISIVSFVTTVYYTYDTSGCRSYNTSVFIGCGLLSCYMSCCISIGVFCVIRTYTRLNGTLLTISQKSKVLNRQIIKSLTMQTCLPMLTLYIPVGLLLICPLLEINVGLLSNFVGMTMSIYPAIDPLIAICIIDEFRNRITGFFMKPRATSVVLSIVPSPIVPSSISNVEI